MSFQKPVSWFTDAFDPISLEALNSKAAMMRRIDNKYIVTNQRLMSLVPSLRDRFDVLEIADNRNFTYDSRYFDDDACTTYTQHHKGQRKRFKIRTRHYLDSDLCYLEVKVKGLRGMTEKHRIPYDPVRTDALTKDAWAFAKQAVALHYGYAFDQDLQPTLDVRYSRITLVARAGGERLTIDTNLQFGSGDTRISLGTGLFIVEAKSAKGRGFADKVLRDAGERPVNGCSKYCVGLAAMRPCRKRNRFLPALRKLGLIDHGESFDCALRSGLASQSTEPQLDPASKL